MTAWKIKPDEVQSLLKGLEPRLTTLTTVLDAEDIEAIPANLTSGAPVTTKVRAAMATLLGDQSDEIEVISNRIAAGMNGVVNATIAYQIGQQEQAATFQREMVKAAESGDLSYFEKHGLTGTGEGER